MATSDHIAPFVPFVCTRKQSQSFSDNRNMTGKTHLVEQYGEENLENQQHDPGDQASICSGALHKWGGILKGEYDEAENEGDYLNDRGFNHYVDKERILICWPNDPVERIQRQVGMGTV
jgi:hypothetical protein